MRIVLSLALFLSPVGAAIAGPLNLGTFQVSGNGGFGCDRLGGTFDFYAFFSGSNTDYTISAESPGVGGSSTQHLQFVSCGATVGEDVVLADTNPPSFNLLEPFNASFGPPGSAPVNLPATFQLGDGSGYLDIYDQASAQPGNPATLIATAMLIGYVTVNSVQTTLPQYPSWQGTYAISPDPPAQAPEPGCAAMILMAALWPAAGAAACSARRRIQSR